MKINTDFNFGYKLNVKINEIIDHSHVVYDFETGTYWNELYSDLDDQLYGLFQS